MIQLPMIMLESPIALISLVAKCSDNKTEFFGTKEGQAFEDPKKGFTALLVQYLKAGISPDTLKSFCGDNRRMIKKIDEKFGKIVERKQIEIDISVKVDEKIFGQFVKSLKEQDALVTENSSHAILSKSKKEYKSEIKKLEKSGVSITQIVNDIYEKNPGMAKKIAKKHNLDISHLVPKK